MRKISKELEQNKDTSYNRLITVSLVDKDLEALAFSINNNLRFQKDLKFESERVHRDLKRSISDIAHDLRTPITVIKGNLQILEKQKLQESDRECLRISSEKTDELRDMVNAFFEIALLESGDNEVKLVETDINRLIMELLLEREVDIKARNIEPDLCFLDKPLMVRLDRVLFKRMLDNLLNNILKYALGTFKMELKESEDKIIITFSNPYSYFSEPDLDHIFDRTYRADENRSMPGSAGLGLYIVRLLAQKQDMLVNARKDKNILYFDIIIKKENP